LLNYRFNLATSNELKSQLSLLMKFKFLLLALFLFSFSDFAQVLPTSRAVDWSRAGYQGIVPDYTTVVDITTYGGLGDGTTINDTALTHAINSLSGANGVIYFPAGTYLFNATATLRSGLIIRGAASDSTTLKFDLGPNSTADAIVISGSNTSISTMLVNNATKDTSAIDVADASAFAAGDYIKLSFNDSSLLFSSWAYGTVGQVAKIASVTSNTIVLESPLRMNYDTLTHAKITKLNMVTGVGIECLKIHRADATVGQTNSITFTNAAQCWVTGIESYMCNFAHIAINTSTNISIKGSYFHEAYAYGGGGQGYGVLCQSTTGECLTENNIFNHLRHSMLIQSGANGNVYGYNYSKEPFWSEPNLPSNSAGDMVLHGNYPYSNLFEGNIGQNMVIDDSHGQNGPYNTYFRNRGELYGIFMNNNPASNNQNLIGNEVTNTGFALGFYYISGTGHLEHGNNVNGTIHATGTTTLADTSYYYLTRPAFLQSMNNWPSIGIPNTLNSGTIPAKQRFDINNFTTCSTVLTTAITNYTVTENQLSFFPNPANGLVYIKCTDNISEPITLKIYNAIGDVMGMYTITSTTQTIDVSNYSSGIYLMRASTKMKNYLPSKLVVR
jgi:hypothetical protein